MNFLKNLAKSELGQQVLTTARQTVEEKFKELQVSSASTTTTTTTTSVEATATKKEFSLGEPSWSDGDKDYPSRLKTLKEYASSSNLPHWLFAPIDVITQADLSIAYLKHVLDEESKQNPNFLAICHQSRNVFHHFNTYPEDYQRLIIQYANSDTINARDNNGQTPLHYIAKSGNLKTFILLWSYGADIDKSDNQGLYALDCAVQSDNSEILKAILALGKPGNSAFHESSRCPRKSSKCFPVYEKEIKYYAEIRKAVSSTVKYSNTNPSHLRAQNFDPLGQKDIVALSIDGGGMKGVLALILMKQMETWCAGLIKLFNYIGGTSTGSIIALGLAKYKNIDQVLRSYFRLKFRIVLVSKRLNFEVKSLGTSQFRIFLVSKRPNLEIAVLETSQFRIVLVSKRLNFEVKSLETSQFRIVLFSKRLNLEMAVLETSQFRIVLVSKPPNLEMAVLETFEFRIVLVSKHPNFENDVFVGSRPYSGQGLETALLNEFGDSSLENIAKTSNIMIGIPVTRVDVSPPALHFFRSYFDGLGGVPGSDDPQWSAAKIVRASSAAPSFFPPVDGKYMDGGLISNNPTLDILTDCQRIRFANPQGPRNRIIVSIGTGALEKKIQNLEMAAPTTVSGILNTVTQIMHFKDVLIDQITASDGPTVERARWMADAMGMCYFRFTPNLSFPVAIDEKEDVALIDAMLAVKYDSVSMINDFKMLSSLFKPQN
uniref:phospholipase A2 n=1 Tax=Caenorhabditis japonica TaxID=281687 RepID=A0A8R1HYL3_CAEJA